MTGCVRVLATVALLAVPLPALAGDPSASIPSPAAGHSSAAGHWEGTAAETPGLYAGPYSAKVTLDLAPDGTFTETWKEGARTRKTSGTWREGDKGVVLESSDPSRERLTLRRKGNALYTIAMEPLPTGRATTMSILLNPAPR